MKSITPILIALLLIAGDMPTRAQPPDSLVGTWRLVSFSREIVATKEVVQAFGGHGAGFATYTADGRYMSPIIDSARKPPAQPMA